jgi:hypothetical protein
MAKRELEKQRIDKEERRLGPGGRTFARVSVLVADESIILCNLHYQQLLQILVLVALLYKTMFVNTASTTPIFRTATP